LVVKKKIWRSADNYIGEPVAGRAILHGSIIAGFSLVVYEKRSTSLFGSCVEHDDDVVVFVCVCVPLRLGITTASGKLLYTVAY